MIFTTHEFKKIKIIFKKKTPNLPAGSAFFADFTAIDDVCLLIGTYLKQDRSHESAPSRWFCRIVDN